MKLLILSLLIFHSAFAIAEVWNDDPIKEWFGLYQVMNPEGRSCSDGQFTKLETSKGAYLLGSNIHFSKVNQAKSVEADADCSYEVETNWVKPSITISTHSRCGKVQEDSIEKLTFTKDEINYDRFEGKSKKLVENCRYMKVKK